MTQYNVGDKVTVRSDLLIGEQYAMENSDTYDTFIDEMVYFLGKEVTIAEIEEYDGELEYLIEEDGQECSWTDEMFEDESLKGDGTE